MPYISPFRDLLPSKLPDLVNNTTPTMDEDKAKAEKMAAAKKKVFSLTIC